MKMWIARNYNNRIALYDKEPKEVYGVFAPPLSGTECYLPMDWFPEITFKNSPQQVEIKLIEVWK